MNQIISHGMNPYIVFALISSVIAIVYGLSPGALDNKKESRQRAYAGNRRRHPSGSESVSLNRQYKTIGAIAAVLFVILWASLSLSSAVGSSLELF